MSGAAPDHNPGTPAPDAGTESRDAPPAQATWWKKVALAYQRRPLLYGFLTVLGLVLLAATLSPLFSGVEPATVGVGQQSTPAAQLHAIAENLGRMDEFGQANYAELLRDSLNPWMRRLKPTGTWQPDPYLPLVVPVPQVREAAIEEQRLRALIAAKDKQLKSKQGPANPAEVAKERSSLLEMSRQVQALEANLEQFRQKMSKDLGGQTFSIEDARVIQGAVSARDISNRLRSNLAQRRGKVDGLELAQELFDWTIRNVALDERDQPTTELAWESLLWGQASNPSRAWIFLELCRQQNLDAVMLAYRDPKGAGYKDWLPAVFLAAEAAAPNLYLFDHRWGIPIPGPGGQGVATLTQALEAPEVLAQLDVVRTYPVRANELQGVVARVDISPYLLSRRMQILEAELHGPDRVVLTLGLSNLAARLQKVKGLAGLEGWSWPGECLANSRSVPPAALRHKFALFGLHGVEQKGEHSAEVQEEHKRSFPELAAMEARERTAEALDQPEVTLETVQREQREKKVPGFLWRGRTLQFRGVFADADDHSGKAAKKAAASNGPRQGAANVYHSGRMTDRELDDWRTEIEADLAKVQQFRSSLTEKDAGPDQLAIVDFKISQLQSQLAQLPAVRLERQFVRLMATYWLAQIAYERGSYGDAAEYFRYLRDKEAPAIVQILDAMPSPTTELEKVTRQQVELVIKPKLSTWIIGANYNLARALEAQGLDAEAIEVYKADTSADQRPGSLYRARRLQQKLTEPAKAAEGKKSAEGKKPKDDKAAGQR